MITTSCMCTKNMPGKGNKNNIYKIPPLLYTTNNEFLFGFDWFFSRNFYAFLYTPKHRKIFTCYFEKSSVQVEFIFEDFCIENVSTSRVLTGDNKI